ncbi:hypothetical protein HDZ31DRAFT_65602 [Schizophyllum fasciatum]
MPITFPGITKTSASMFSNVGGSPKAFALALAKHAARSSNLSRNVTSILDAPEERRAFIAAVGDHERRQGLRLMGRTVLPITVFELCLERTCDAKLATVKIENGGSRCVVIYNAPQPQSFVDNLNATRPCRGDIDGVWSFIPAEPELRKYVARIARRKASRV